MAGRAALFDLVDAVVAALEGAQAGGQPLEGVEVHDGPKHAYGDKYVVITTVTEAERNDEFSLIAGAYEITYEVGLGFGITDPTGDSSDEDVWNTLRRQLGVIVQGAAAAIETDAALSSLTQGVDLVPTAYSPIHGSNGLQVIATAEVVADVVVEP